LLCAESRCSKSGDKGGNLHSGEAILAGVGEGGEVVVKGSEVASAESVLGFCHGPELRGCHSRCSRCSRWGGRGLSEVEVSRVPVGRGAGFAVEMVRRRKVSRKYRNEGIEGKGQGIGVVGVALGGSNEQCLIY
jgi:hypothetical protein